MYTLREKLSASRGLDGRFLLGVVIIRLWLKSATIAHDRLSLPIIYNCSTK